MSLKKLFATRAVATAVAAGFATHAFAAPVAVDLELVLAADVSGSLDLADFELQRDGCVAAFQSAAVQNAIAAGALGKIAVSLVY